MRLGHDGGFSKVWVASRHCAEREEGDRGATSAAGAAQPAVTATSAATTILDLMSERRQG
jgi:hypothetical protein